MIKNSDIDWLDKVPKIEVTLANGHTATYTSHLVHDGQGRWIFTDHHDMMVEIHKTYIQHAATLCKTYADQIRIVGMETAMVEPGPSPMVNINHVCLPDFMLSYVVAKDLDWKPPLGKDGDQLIASGKKVKLVRKHCSLLGGDSWNVLEDTDILGKLIAAEGINVIQGHESYVRAGYCQLSHEEYSSGTTIFEAVARAIIYKYHDFLKQPLLLPLSILRDEE